MPKLFEDKRNQLMAQGRRGTKEKDGKSRYEKRVKSKVASTVREFNEIDMQSLFVHNILTINVPVRGETNNYLVRIKFGGFLDLLRNQLDRQNGVLNLRAITRALLDAFNQDDVYIHCNCLHPDTKIKLLDGTTPTIKEMKNRFDKGEKLYVYSVDEKGDFKPGEVEKVWITGETTEFIKITLDNGAEILTTPEHLYMLRDGSYQEAQYLEVNQSLMPMYFSFTNNGYELIKLNSKARGRCSTYKEVANYYKQDEIEEAKLRVNPDDNMPYKIAIHHIDFNKNNNNPENLKIMTAREHWEYHAHNMSIKWLDPDFREKTINALTTPEHGAKISATKQNWTEEQRNSMAEKSSKNNIGKHFRPHSAEERAYMSERRKGVSNGPRTESQKVNIGLGIRKAYESFTEEQWEKKRQDCANNLLTPESTEKRRIGIANYWDNLRETMSPEEINTMLVERFKDRAPRMLKDPETASENYRQAALKRDNVGRMKNYWNNLTPEQKEEHKYNVRLAKITNTVQKILDAGEIVTPESYEKFKPKKGSAPWNSIFATFEDLIKYFNLNHKVAKIEKIKLCNTPVYDVKVKDWSNFVVDAGVVLHNCPDYQYRFAYWSSIKDINAGPPEKRPAKITNPRNDKGPGCKHIMLVLSNNSWLIKVASVINNWIIYMSKYRKKQYADIVYPAIYGHEYEEPVQLSMDDNQDLNDRETIDKANAEGRTRGQFKVGNPYRYQPRNAPIKGQMSMEDETEEGEEQ